MKAALVTENNVEESLSREREKKVGVSCSDVDCYTNQMCVEDL